MKCYTSKELKWVNFNDSQQYGWILALLSGKNKERPQKIIFIIKLKATKMQK